MELPYYFVRDKGSRITHHWDYARERATQALCGHQYEGEIVYEGTKRPGAVCRECQELIPPFVAQWWSEIAEDLALECAVLRARCADAERELQVSRTHIEKLTYQVGLAEGRTETLKAKVENQRKNLRDLQSARAAAKHAGQQGMTHPRPAKSASPTLPVIKRRTLDIPKQK